MNKLARALVTTALFLAVIAIGLTAYYFFALAPQAQQDVADATNTAPPASPAPPRKNTKRTRPFKVLIDPGHNKEKWGASGIAGKEYTLNHKVARYLKNYLERDKRFVCELSRNEEDYTEHITNAMEKHYSLVKGIVQQRRGRRHVKDLFDPNHKAMLNGVRFYALENEFDCLLSIHFNAHPHFVIERKIVPVPEPPPKTNVSNNDGERKSNMPKTKRQGRVARRGRVSKRAKKPPERIKQSESKVRTRRRGRRKRTKYKVVYTRRNIPLRKGFHVIVSPFNRRFDESCAIAMAIRNRMALRYPVDTAISHSMRYMPDDVTNRYNLSTLRSNGISVRTLIVIGDRHDAAFYKRKKKEFPFNEVPSLLLECGFVHNKIFLHEEVLENIAHHIYQGLIDIYETNT